MRKRPRPDQIASILRDFQADLEADVDRLKLLVAELVLDRRMLQEALK